MHSAIRELLETLVAAVLLFFVIQGLVQNFQVEGPSMEPTVHSGQLLLVNKAVYLDAGVDLLGRFLPFIDPSEGERSYLFHAPDRGDIVVFRDPLVSEFRIKRVIAIPGDTVEIRGGRTLVNGLPLDEPYLGAEAHDSMSSRRLRPEEYFVMGDNRLYSRDSRSTGPVQADDIVGKAWVTFWPPSELGFLNHYALSAQSQ